MDSSTGIQVFDTKISHLEYADDLVLVSSSFDELSRQLERLVTECRRWGLTVNAAKTKVMTVERSTTSYPGVVLDGTEVERVEGFTYLGHWVAADGSIESEVKARINRASKSWRSLGGALVGQKQLSGRTKCKLFRAIVVPSLVYGAETWPATEGLLKRLDTFQSRCLRRIWGINWWDYIRTEDVLHRSHQPSVSTIIRRSRLRWFGHVMRMDEIRLPKRILDWKPCGTRPRGRPRSRWIDLVSQDLCNCGIQSMEEAKREAQDRGKWQRLVYGPMRPHP